MREIEYQIGVNVLGFPIYCVHRVSTNKSEKSNLEQLVSSREIVVQR